MRRYNLGMNLTLRPFDTSERDYETIVSFERELFPDYGGTVAEMRFGDQTRDPKVKHARFIAQVDGTPIDWP